MNSIGVIDLKSKKSCINPMFLESDDTLLGTITWDPCKLAGTFESTIFPISRERWDIRPPWRAYIFL